MVRRSTLISFCASLLSGCGSKNNNFAAAATTDADTSANPRLSGNRSNLRGQILQVAKPTTSDRLDEYVMTDYQSNYEATNLAEFAAGISAYTAAYKQSILFTSAAAKADHDQQSTQLLNEDFVTPSNLMTIFDDKDNIEYMAHSHGRTGVISLENSNDSYITTSNLLSSRIMSSMTPTKFIITFSYRPSNLSTTHDGFCVDFSTDDGLTWQQEECYYYGIDFESSDDTIIWYDDYGVELVNGRIEGMEIEDSLSVRLIGRGAGGGEVLFDRIQVVLE